MDIKVILLGCIGGLIGYKLGEYKGASEMTKKFTEGLKDITEDLIGGNSKTFESDEKI